MQDGLPEDPTPVTARLALFEAQMRGSETLDLQFVRGFNADVIAELRAHGQVRNESSGRTRLILTSRGRRTGEQRPVPMSYLVVDYRLLVVASRGGADNHPLWYLNLLANPDVLVELNRRVFPAHAKPTEGQDRASLFAAITAAAPHFGIYQSRTLRELPVVELLGAELTHAERQDSLHTT